MPGKIIVQIVIVYPIDLRENTEQSVRLSGDLLSGDNVPRSNESNGQNKTNDHKRRSCDSRIRRILRNADKKHRNDKANRQSRRENVLEKKRNPAVQFYESVIAHPHGVVDVLDRHVCFRVLDLFVIQRHYLVADHHFIPSEQTVEHPVVFDLHYL